MSHGSCLEGGHLYWSLLPEKKVGAKSTFYVNMAKKWGGPSPSVSLGDCIPTHAQEY